VKAPIIALSGQMVSKAQVGDPAFRALTLGTFGEIERISRMSGLLLVLTATFWPSGMPDSVAPCLRARLAPSREKPRNQVS
jgi:hypothetical protein